MSRNNASAGRKAIGKNFFQTAAKEIREGNPGEIPGRSTHFPIIYQPIANGVSTRYEYGDPLDRVTLIRYANVEENWEMERHGTKRIISE
jgi:hypothetical protein